MSGYANRQSGYTQNVVCASSILAPDTKFFVATFLSAVFWATVENSITMCYVLFITMIACLCKGIRDREICEAVQEAAEKADVNETVRCSVAVICRMTGAGTTCGGCVKTIKSLLLKAQSNKCF